MSERIFLMGNVKIFFGLILPGNSFFVVDCFFGCIEFGIASVKMV